MSLLLKPLHIPNGSRKHPLGHIAIPHPSFEAPILRPCTLPAAYKYFFFYPSFLLSFYQQPLFFHIKIARPSKYVERRGVFPKIRTRRDICAEDRALSKQPTCLPMFESEQHLHSKSLIPKVMPVVCFRWRIKPRLPSFSCLLLHHHPHTFCQKS
jgi:hypothetical protein